LRWRRVPWRAPRFYRGDRHSHAESPQPRLSQRQSSQVLTSINSINRVSYSHDCAICAEESIGEESAMAMLKVIEVLAESTKSWEDATQQAIADASKTVRNVKSIYIENFEATVENDQIRAYRINAKISFVLE
jgi:flavin-binding protein dodecin